MDILKELPTRVSSLIPHVVQKRINLYILFVSIPLLLLTSTGCRTASEYRLDADKAVATIIKDKKGKKTKLIKPTKVPKTQEPEKTTKKPPLPRKGGLVDSKEP